MTYAERVQEVDLNDMFMAFTDMDDIMQKLSPLDASIQDDWRAVHQIVILTD